MAAASPEFFKPQAFSPRLHLLLDSAAAIGASADDEYYSCCRTPTDAGIGHLGQAATCPPAPRKPRPQPDSACRKRLFDVDVDVISLRFDDLEAIFRPCPDAHNKKQSRRRSQGQASLN